MSVAIITGSGGLIGSQAARHFAALGLHIVGVDNDMRRFFFGPEGSVQGNLDQLAADLGGDYSHVPVDIRSRDAVNGLLRRYGKDVTLVIHAASQPAHDSQNPLIDWDINATGTANMLEATRRHAAGAVFVFLSTIKVYGQEPNRLPLVAMDTRFDLPPTDRLYRGIDETMSIDNGAHSVFGASKTAADIFAQEYGRYLDLQTVILRGGCLTGPAHAAVEAHGFLAYLTKRIVQRRPYRVLGSGKQVRDQIHTIDVARAIERVWHDPPWPGAVFNLGGGRGQDVSVLEALVMTEEATGIEPIVEWGDERRGDHKWWITNMAQFEVRYPGWFQTYTVPMMLKEIFAANADRWRP